MHDALLAAGNSVAGGALTEEDLESVLPADADGRALSSGRATTVIGPWLTVDAFQTSPLRMSVPPEVRLVADWSETPAGRRRTWSAYGDMDPEPVERTLTA